MSLYKRKYTDLNQIVFISHEESPLIGNWSIDSELRFYIFVNIKSSYSGKKVRTHMFSKALLL